MRSYSASDLPVLLEPRLNGVSAIGRSPARGVRVDVYLRRYRIDPARDFVLLVNGTASPGQLRDLAQAWLTLRYWGFAHENLGILQGSVAELPESVRTATALAPPIDGTVRVPSLERDHFSVLAALGDVRRTVEREQPLLDARQADAFEGTLLSESGSDDTCLQGERCTALRGGRIPGAVHLPLEALLTADGTRLLPLAALDDALSAAGIVSKSELVVYDDDGAGSALATFALLAVVGRPARWYAGSFVEWGSLTASHPEPALHSLPSDSPWRTDTELQAEVWAEAASGVRPLIVDPYAATTDAALAADRAYLASPPPLPAPGGGGAECAPPP